ncbi:hypothetical protein M405DRAFT_881608 [Rhizopogon salebrosus TDB-379]|nr:hypothetical protein M405DRAFT_881608 [Rhizopogon salebrosus TDB-379]
MYFQLGLCRSKLFLSPRTRLACLSHSDYTPIYLRADERHVQLGRIIAWFKVFNYISIKVGRYTASSRQRKPVTEISQDSLEYGRLNILSDFTDVSALREIVDMRIMFTALQPLYQSTRWPSNSHWKERGLEPAGGLFLGCRIVQGASRESKHACLRYRHYTPITHPPLHPLFSAIASLAQHIGEAKYSI